MKRSEKITNGSGGWWFDDHRFYNLDKSPLDYESESADELRRLLCARLFNLYRWAGEEGRFGPVSVGFHSLLVSHLAGRLAEVRGMSRDCVRMAVSCGAAHDLGERLGLGDIVAPILRKHPEIESLNERHQLAAAHLFSPWWPGVVVMPGESRTIEGVIVHDADHLAAAIERRHLFDDDSGDCEAPGMDAILAEMGIEVFFGCLTHQLKATDGKVCLFALGCGASAGDLEEAIRCAR